MENSVQEKEIPYTSKITQELIVMGAEDIAKFEEIKNDPNRKVKLIGTHSEHFHCDEVLATTMLQYTKEFANAIIIRTRNEDVLKQLDIICDVGSIFDPAARRFDHH